MGTLLAILVGSLLGSPSPARAGALEDYVGKPDPSFNWKRTEQKKTQDGVLTHLELVSQTWRGQFWSHHLLVFKPEQVRHADMGLIFITGGDYNAPKDEDIKPLCEVARRAGIVVALLNKVPNQPLYGGKEEDALIAYTFDRFLKTGDKSWPLLFPMVKSAARGMDTIQQFAKAEWHQDITKFAVTGASKRGWTTWLTGAVDKRVMAIAPMVIDMLNMKQQLRWAEKAYGRQSEEINDYTELNLHMLQDDQAMVQLRSWVDPYSYRERYTMPKLLLLGTNDPYWTVDSLRHYFSDLPAQKWIFQTPNAGHDLAGGEAAIQTLAAWLQMLADKQKLPRLQWNFAIAGEGVRASLRVDQPAKKIALWTAESKDRDLRDDKWTSKELPLLDGGLMAYADLARPKSGYLAYMLEATFVSSTGNEYRLSSEARVVPDFGY